MRELERIARAKNLIVEEPEAPAIEKKASVNTLESSSDLFLDMMKLASVLRDRGFTSQASQLEEKAIILKKAMSEGGHDSLYSFWKETGESLVSDAHSSTDADIPGHKVMNANEIAKAVHESTKDKPTGQEKKAELAVRMAKMVNGLVNKEAQVGTGILQGLFGGATGWGVGTAVPAAAALGGPEPGSSSIPSAMNGAGVSATSILQNFREESNGILGQFFSSATEAQLGLRTLANVDFRTYFSDQNIQNGSAINGIPQVNEAEYSQIRAKIAKGCDDYISVVGTTDVTSLPNWGNIKINYRISSTEKEAVKNNIKQVILSYVDKFQSSSKKLVNSNLAILDELLVGDYKATVDNIDKVLGTKNQVLSTKRSKDIMAAVGSISTSLVRMKGFILRALKGMASIKQIYNNYDVVSTISQGLSGAIKAVDSLVEKLSQTESGFKEYTVDMEDKVNDALTLSAVIIKKSEIAKNNIGNIKSFNDGTKKMLLENIDKLKKRPTHALYFLKALPDYSFYSVSVGLEMKSMADFDRYVSVLKDIDAAMDAHVKNTSEILDRENKEETGLR